MCSAAAGKGGSSHCFRNLNVKVFNMPGSQGGGGEGGGEEKEEEVFFLFF